MQRAKKISSLLLILVLLTTMLVGCGGEEQGKKQGKEQVSPLEKKENKKGGVGRFLESEVELPENINSILTLRKLSDGTLGVVAENEKKYYVLKSKDLGKKWEKKEITGLPQEHFPHVAMSPDGTVVLISYAQGGTVKGKQVDAKGAVKGFSFELPKGSSENGSSENHVQQIGYDTEGNLFINDSSGSLLQVNPSGGSCKKALDTKGISIRYFYAAGNILTAVHEEGVLLYDTKTKKQLESERVLDELVKKNRKLSSTDTDSGTPMIFSAGLKADGIIYANESGIFHVTRGGSVAEQLVDGSLTELSSGNILFLAQEMMDENHIFLAVSDGENKKDKLLHYSYDKKAASVPEQELTVYALDESNVVRSAAAAFRKRHPDVYVKLEFGLSGDDSVTLEDALNVLNTNILAKKGPDVMILDGMPLESYIEKGILADISDVVAEVDKKEGIFSNIREGSKKERKIYAMPVRVLLPVIEGSKEVVNAGGSLEELAKYAEKHSKSGAKTITQPKGVRTLLRDFYYVDSALWMKQDGSLDQTKLMQYLKNAKLMYDLNPDKKQEDSLDRIMGDSTFEGSKVGTCNDLGLITGEWKVAFGTLAGVYDVQMMCSARDQTKADYDLLNREQVKSYIPSVMAGVTAGDHTDIAKEFVKELLEQKSGCDTDGIPVNRTAYEKVCKEKMNDPAVKEGSCIAFGDSDKKTYGYSFVNLKQSDVDKLTGIMEGLNKPTMINRVIQELVLEQGEKYLRGEQTLEQAVGTIMQKVNLYLAE